MKNWRAYETQTTATVFHISGKAGQVWEIITEDRYLIIDTVANEIDDNGVIRPIPAEYDFEALQLWLKLGHVRPTFMPALASLDEYKDYVEFPKNKKFPLETP